MSTSDETKTMHDANRSHARSDGSMNSLKVEAKPLASYCMQPLSHIDLRLWEGRLRRDSSHPEKPFPKCMSRVNLEHAPISEVHLGEFEVYKMLALVLALIREAKTPNFLSQFFNE